MGRKTRFRDLPSGLDVLADHGGESVIYRLPASYSVPPHKGPFLFKRYRPRIVTGHEIAVESSLDRIVNAYETAGARHKKIITEVAAWPVATVTGDRGALGLIMREIGPEFVGATGKSLVAPLEKWIQLDRKVRDRGLMPFTDDGRKRYVRRTMLYFSMVHSLGFVIGDISLNNILAFVPSSSDQPKRCTPGFIEVDTYRPINAAPAMPQRQTYDFMPPEAKLWQQEASRLKAAGASKHDVRRCESKARIQTLKSDVFKAGLLALRLYDTSPYPTQARFQASATKHLVRVFGRGVLTSVRAAVESNPTARPTMHELAQAFLKN